MKANPSTKSASWSASGRIILSGEYGALYGKPVVVVAVDKKAIVTVSENKKSAKNQKNKKEWFIEIEKATEKFLRKKNRMQNKTYTTLYNVPRSLRDYFGFDKALLSASAASKLTKRLLISLMSEDGDLFAETIREEQKILCETINLQKSILKLIEDINIFGSSKICENTILIYGKRENVKKTARENGLIFYKLNQSDEGIKPHDVN